MIKIFKKFFLIILIVCLIKNTNAENLIEKAAEVTAVDLDDKDFISRYPYWTIIIAATGTGLITALGILGWHKFFADDNSKLILNEKDKIKEEKEFFDKMDENWKMVKEETDKYKKILLDIEKMEGKDLYEKASKFSEKMKISYNAKIFEAAKKCEDLRITDKLTPDLENQGYKTFPTEKEINDNQELKKISNEDGKILRFVSGWMDLIWNKKYKSPEDLNNQVKLKKYMIRFCYDFVIGELLAPFESENKKNGKKYISLVPSSRD